MHGRTLPYLVAPLCKSQMHAGHPSSSICFQGESCSIPVCYKDGVSKRLCTVVAEEQRRVQQDLRSETGFLLLLPTVKWQSSPLPLEPAAAGDKGSQGPLEAHLLHPASHRHCVWGPGTGHASPPAPPNTGLRRVVSRTYRRGEPLPPQSKGAGEGVTLVALPLCSAESLAVTYRRACGF